MFSHIIPPQHYINNHSYIGKYKSQDNGITTQFDPRTNANEAVCVRG